MKHKRKASITFLFVSLMSISNISLTLTYQECKDLISFMLAPNNGNLARLKYIEPSYKLNLSDQYEWVEIKSVQVLAPKEEMKSKLETKRGGILDYGSTGVILLTSDLSEFESRVQAKFGMYIDKKMTPKDYFSGVNTDDTISGDLCHLSIRKILSEYFWIEPAWLDRPIRENGFYSTNTNVLAVLSNDESKVALVKIDAGKVYKVLYYFKERISRDYFFALMNLYAGESA